MLMRTIAGALVLFHGANGLFMGAAPERWWGQVPGVADTGPFNPHFVSDVGLAFLASAFGFAAFAVRPEARWAARVAALFPALHAGLHLAGIVLGRDADAGLDLAMIALPAAVGLVICLPWKDGRHA